MENIVLQNLVFPNNDKFKAHWRIFYQGSRLITEDGNLRVPAFQTVDFATYMNGCPINKWKEYTGLTNLSLFLKASGHFTVYLTSFKLEPIQPVRRELYKQTFDLPQKTIIQLNYLDLRGDFVAFDFEAETNSVVYGGWYAAQYDKDQVKNVNLAIATTTFKKEDYIIGNVQAITRDLLQGHSEIKDHLYVNVVDNGRTLKASDIEIHDHVRLFFNDNVGGSGGFSRGMLESIHMKAPITHVLLMDDDVLVLTESLYRTYTLLKLIKNEFNKAFISGTMLELDAMWVMHEDIGLVRQDKSFYHAKPIYDATRLDSILESNRVVPHHKHSYAGWWYCCIPAQTIREKGLALPLFIRGDDVEYGLRCHPQILTMSGIGIWHMSFAGKFSVHTNYYQEFRNMLIVQAAGQKIPDVDVYGRWKAECMRSALTFDYKGWEILLLALEDYMKGPEFIETDRGTEILQRNKQFAEKLEPWSASEGPSMVIDDIWGGDLPMTRKQRIKYYLTYNGQRFCSETKLNKKEPGILRQDWDHKPGCIAFRDKIYVVNPIERTGIMRHIDKVKFKELMKRQKADIKAYEGKKTQLEKAYRDAYPYLISEEFWRKYLKLDQ